MEDLKLTEQMDIYNSCFPKLEFSFIYQIAYCHLCKKRSVVFCCYKNFKAASCTKKYCVNCLQKHYNEEILAVIEKQKEWNCPFKQNACCCSKCQCDIRNYRPIVEFKPSPLSKQQAYQQHQSIDQVGDFSYNEENSYYDEDGEDSLMGQSEEFSGYPNYNIDDLVSDSSFEDWREIRKEEVIVPTVKNFDWNKYFVQAEKESQEFMKRIYEGENPIAVQQEVINKQENAVALRSNGHGATGSRQSLRRQAMSNNNEESKTHPNHHQKSSFSLSNPRPNGFQRQDQHKALPLKPSSDLKNKLILKKKIGSKKPNNQLNKLTIKIQLTPQSSQQTVQQASNGPKRNEKLKHKSLIVNKNLIDKKNNIIKQQIEESSESNHIEIDKDFNIIISKAYLNMQ